MKNVQLAIRDRDYAQSLRSLLLRDGTHRVYMVDRPDLSLDGVVVVDGNRLDLSLHDPDAERFVVITKKGQDQLSRIWDAGVRHVVFLEDAPTTAQLAVIAAELRLPRTGARADATPVSHAVKPRFAPQPDMPVLDPAANCGGRCLRNFDCKKFEL